MTKFRVELPFARIVQFAVIDNPENKNEFQDLIILGSDGSMYFGQCNYREGSIRMERIDLYEEHVSDLPAVIGQK